MTARLVAAVGLFIIYRRRRNPRARPPPPLRTGSLNDEHSLEASTRDREQAGGDGARPAMVSESNRSGADRTTAAGEEKEERGQLLFDVPEIRFTKLFINGSFVDAVSGTCNVLPSLAPLLSRIVPCSRLLPNRSVRSSSGSIGFNSY